MRVLVDANIFLSFLLFPRRDSPSRQVIQAAILGTFVLLVPEELLEELAARAREKPYLAERIHPEEVDELAQILSTIAEPIPQITEPIPALTRDPKDDYLIAYALVGSADYLVTGDRDLLALRQVGDVKIVTPREFATLLGKNRADR